METSCAYRQFPSAAADAALARPVCYGLPISEDHHADGHGHAHVGSCERGGRCEAGRYFLGTPGQTGREAWWGAARSVLPLAKVSPENGDGCDVIMPHIASIHSLHGKPFIYYTQRVCLCVFADNYSIYKYVYLLFCKQMCICLFACLCSGLWYFLTTLFNKFLSLVDSVLFAIEARSQWEEDSVVSSPDGGSASDSGDRYRGDHHFRSSPQEPSKMETLIRATQQMIKEEENRMQLRKGPPAPADTPTLGHVNGLAKSHSACFASDLSVQGALLCRGPASHPSAISPAPSPVPLSRLGSPGSEHLAKPKDYLSAQQQQQQTDLSPQHHATAAHPHHHLHHPHHPPSQLPYPGSCAASPTPALYPSHPRPAYLDKHAAAYSLTGYALEQLYEAEALRGYCGGGGSSPYEVASHLRMPGAEQAPGHKGTSVIITNGS